ncbi:hypothetical protein KUA50_009515 [Segatella hominis]|uniref:hypothetical protein n=1 Tax=Segatella hominis TaxID=2518605 RepID=UPI001C43CDC3|nr:hypothetical protein [Segatella hominis]WOZ80306.1 hypothetical protein KUA50_009515 [Segatella hominis]
MRKISRKNRIILKPFVFLQKNGGRDMKVYQDSKGNINGYSWNISNKFIQTVVMGGCLLRLMLFPFVGLYLIFHPNEGGKYAFSRKWYNKILWTYSVILPLSVIYYGIRYDDITKAELLLLLGVHIIMLLGAFGAFIDDVFLNNNTVKENSASKSYHYNKNNVDMVAEISKELDCTLQFKGFKTIRELKESCSEVPSSNGVYLVLRRNNQQPIFSISSLGGYVKVPNDSPCYSLSYLQEQYVNGTCILYIGKSTNMRSRLRSYMRFGQGKRASHGGGRAIWQMTDVDDFVICWAETLENSRMVEWRMIQAFKLSHEGKRPFANMSD